MFINIFHTKLLLKINHDNLFVVCRHNLCHLLVTLLSKKRFKLVCKEFCATQIIKRVIDFDLSHTYNNPLKVIKRVIDFDLSHTYNNPLKVISSDILGDADKI